MPRLPASLKLALAFVTVLAITLIPPRHASWLLLVAAMVLLTAVLSRVSLVKLLIRLLKLEPLALGVAGLAIFQPNGLTLAGLLVARASLCLFTMLLLSATTPFPEILGVLRAIRCPSLLLTTLALMHRYLFVLADESRRMQRARLARTYTPSRTRIWLLHASTIGHLFIRAANRADRIYQAMCARGFNP